MRAVAPPKEIRGSKDLEPLTPDETERITKPVEGFFHRHEAEDLLSDDRRDRDKNVPTIGTNMSQQEGESE